MTHIDTYSRQGERQIAPRSYLRQSESTPHIRHGRPPPLKLQPVGRLPKPLPPPKSPKRISTKPYENPNNEASLLYRTTYSASVNDLSAATNRSERLGNLVGFHTNLELDNQKSLRQIVHQRYASQDGISARYRQDGSKQREFHKRQDLLPRQSTDIREKIRNRSSYGGAHTVDSCVDKIRKQPRTKGDGRFRDSQFLATKSKSNLIPTEIYNTHRHVNAAPDEEEAFTSLQMTTDSPQYRVRPSAHRAITLDELIAAEKHKMGEGLFREIQMLPIRSRTLDTTDNTETDAGEVGDMYKPQQYQQNMVYLEQHRDPQPSANSYETRPMSYFEDGSDDDNSGNQTNPKGTLTSQGRPLSRQKKFLAPVKAATCGKPSDVDKDFNSPPKVPRKRPWSSRKHPLKSPFPFGITGNKNKRTKKKPKKEKTRKTPYQWQDPYSDTDPVGFARRPSDVVCRPSVGSSSNSNPLIVNQTDLISNAARSADGPATPMPLKSRLLGILSPTALLHRGSQQLHDTFVRVQQGRGKSSATNTEKMREEFKNSISVIGPADQFTDGRVSRWL